MDPVLVYINLPIYPVCVLMSVDIRDILIISMPLDASCFQVLLDDSNQFGVNLTYSASILLIDWHRHSS